ncbi:MAG: hypothetical protein EA397_04735 [Deltaproteobacteria bacterium]|nr:MAG: hypothetical protein EA397_04735 [Deltaproteobacteria bacterium]
MAYCSDFDALLADSGVPAIFLPDREGLLRFDAEWTRGAWGRLGASPEPAPAWVLLRDRDTGFVLLVYTTAVGLLREHPRMDTRHFADRAQAERAREAFGVPPICRESW